MRDVEVDFFKGLLIWSVVLGHCLNIFCNEENELHIILRTFDLPMFMFISGFFTRGSIAKYSLKQFVLNKITNIVLPAIVWIVISFICGDLHSYYFLWAIFISSVTVCLCEELGRKFSSSKLGGALVVLFLVLFHLIPQNIFNISFLYTFFVIGYFSKSINKVGWKFGCFSLILFVALICVVWQPKYTIWSTGGYLLQNTEFMSLVVLLRFVIGMLGIYSVIFVFGRIYDFAQGSFVISVFAKVGQRTLAIYLIQHIVVEIFLASFVKNIGISAYIANNPILCGYIIAPFISLFLLLAMYYLSVLIIKNKYTGWIFGVKIQ